MFGLAYLLKLKYLIFSILHFHFYSFHLLGSLFSSFKIRLRGEKETYPQRLCKYICILTCFRGTSAEGSWEKFNNLLDSTPRGNFGNLGFYFDHPEIVPADLQADLSLNKIKIRFPDFLLLS